MDTSEEGQQSACVLQMIGAWSCCTPGAADSALATDTVTVQRNGDRRRRNVVDRRKTGGEVTFGV